MPRKTKNTTKATLVNGGVGGVGAVAGWLTYKYGVPIEITAPVIAAIFGFIGRWAAKLNPQG